MKTTRFEALQALFLIFILLLPACGSSRSAPVSGRVKVYKGEGHGDHRQCTTSFTIKELRWSAFKMACPSTIVVQVDLPPSLGGIQTLEGGMRDIAVDLRRLGILESRFHSGARDVPVTVARWTNGVCRLAAGRHRAVIIVEHGGALIGGETTAP